MTLESISRHPRLIASLFAAIFAAQVTGIICASMHNVLRPKTHIISAMLAAAFWAAIICRRITNVRQSCTYFRAAILGGIAALFIILTTPILIGIAIRLENMVIGAASIQQTTRHLLIEDVDTIVGGGVFTLIFFGWFLVPIGGIGGVILRWLRTIIAEEIELYEGDDRAKLHIGDE